MSFRFNFNVNSMLLQCIFDVSYWQSNENLKFNITNFRVFSLFMYCSKLQFIVNNIILWWCYCHLFITFMLYLYWRLLCSVLSLSILIILNYEYILPESRVEAPLPAPERNGRIEDRHSLSIVHREWFSVHSKLKMIYFRLSVSNTKARRMAGGNNNKLLPKFPHILSITLYFYCKLDDPGYWGNLCILAT